MSKPIDLPPAPGGTAEEIAFREGFFLGLLVGDGHFGGDGKQPQVTLRMHVRHERLFDWISTYFPGGKRFGPYSHGGRHYYQWMARGQFLRERLLPILARRLTPEVDAPAAARYQAMLQTYGLGGPGEAGAAAAVDAVPAHGAVRAVGAAGAGPAPGAAAAATEAPTSPPPAATLDSQSLDTDHI